jgi:predicted XRE-type DNA-binding protein
VKREKTTYELSSGNVFKDLGLENAEEDLAKADLAIRINGILRKRKLTQAKAAILLEVDQPKISALVNGRLDAFSTEKLIRFLMLLGRNVKIVIEKKEMTKGHLAVVSM